MNKFKMGDIFVYMFLAILALTGILGMRSMVAIQDRERVVIIIVNGEEHKRIALDPNMEPMRIEIDSWGGGYNVLYISYDDVHVIDADCRDRLCIKRGSIKYPGQTIICLPNRLVIKIIGEEKQLDIDDITSLEGKIYI